MYAFSLFSLSSCLVKWLLLRIRRIQMQMSTGLKKGMERFERRARNNKEMIKNGPCTTKLRCKVVFGLKLNRRGWTRNFPCDSRKPRTKLLLLTSLSSIYEWNPVSVVLTSFHPSKREEKPPLTFSSTSPLLCYISLCFWFIREIIFCVLLLFMYQTAFFWVMLQWRLPEVALWTLSSKGSM